MKGTDIILQKISKAKQIRERSRTSCIELENCMLYQQLYLQNKTSMLLSCNICARPKTQAKKQFKRAFKTLSRQQQADYFLMNCKDIQKFINSRVKKNGDLTVVIEQPPNTQTDIIKLRLQIKDDFLYKKFTLVNTQIYTKQKIIKITDVKQQIDLHSFILRKSHGKVKNCIVLQSVEPFTYVQTIRLCFGALDFEDSYNILYKIWTQAQVENIQKTLLQDNRFPRRQIVNKMFDIDMSQPITNKLSFKKQEFMSSQRLKDSQSNNQPLSAIKQKNLTKIYNCLLSTDLIQSLNTFTAFRQQRFGLYYQKNGKKVRKVFNFVQKDVTIANICLSIDQIHHIKRRKPNIAEIKHLNSIPTQRTNLYRQVDSIQNQQYQFIYFRHYIEKNQTIYYVEKSIDLLQFRNRKECYKTGKINYCIWRIKNLGNKIEVLVQADIEYNKNQINIHKITSAYIGQFNEYVKKQKEQQQQNSVDEITIKSDEFQNQYLSQISNQEQFFTVSGSFNSSNQISDKNNSNGNKQMVFRMNKNQGDFLQSPIQRFFQQVVSKLTTEQTSAQQTDQYLKHRHQIFPKNKNNPIYLRQEGHLLFGRQWVISPTGELINIDKQKIKAQSSVLKLVFQRMGRNFFSGKGIMNMSLPIQIFGTDSNIQRLARGFIYAPLYIENASKTKDPVQRMKKIFCFILGFFTSYIKMDKPFNPVIGQTYQGVVDGCPVYAEQISHHPPISSTLLVGRGYRIYGAYEAKVEMGFNSASGINEGFTYIQFQNDKSIVKFNNCAGEMQGIIIGQRAFVFTKKSYIIDQKNMLFCQMHWGKQKNNPRPDSKLNNFFYGKIVKLKQGTNINDYKKIKKNSILQQYGQLNGKFTGKAYFQDQLLFDLDTNPPLIIQEYNPCLPSDSRLRRDIVERKKNNFNQAQDGKEQIQQRARVDKKLRELHKK